MATKPETPTAAAQAAIVELEEELESLPSSIRSARRAGDQAHWFALQTREEDLPLELKRARLVLVEAQLVAAKAELPAAEREAERLADEAQALRDGIAGKRERAAALLAEAAADEAQVPTLRQAARDMAGRVLVDVEEAEAKIAQLRAELGDESDDVPTAEFLGVQRRLRGSVTLPHPHTGEQVLLLAGSVPPPWAAAQIVNPGAWELDVAPSAVFTAPESKRATRRSTRRARPGDLVTSIVGQNDVGQNDDGPTAA